MASAQFFVQLPDAGTELKKVMVYIHGGGFVGGDGSKNSLGPDFIVEKGVVLVSIQYRLGIFGEYFITYCKD